MFKFKNKPRWLIIIINVEYWNYQLIYFPVIFWLIWNCVFKTKSRFYPLALNKGIDETGGFVSADKSAILKLFPSKYLTKYTVINATDYLTEENWNLLGLTFPVFVKPFNLSRGIGVAKVLSLVELNNLLKTNLGKILIEDEILLPVEYAVFVVKYPDEKARILSLTAKEFMHVKGDGKSSIKKLLLLKERYIACKKEINPLWENKWDIIPKENEIIPIQPVGNHNKGTKFLDISSLITPKMEAFFDTIMPSKGVEYGRFDVKANFLTDLETGENLKIIEFNASLAEPVSYLDPKYGYFGVQKIIFRHFKHQLEIGKRLIQLGLKTPTLVKGLQFMLNAKKFKKNVENGKLNDVFIKI